MAKFVFFSFSNVLPIGQILLQRKLRENGISCSVINLSKSVGGGVKYKFYGENRILRFVPASESEVRIASELKRLKPMLRGAKYFGISFFDSPAEYRTSIPLSIALRKMFPAAKIIGGGPAFTGQANEGAILQSKSVFSSAKLDYAIRGEAENSLPELVKLLEVGAEVDGVRGIVHRRGREIFVSKQPAFLSAQELKSIPVTFTRSGKKSVLVYTERGCPFACIFCSVMRKGKPLGADVEAIIDALKGLSKSKQVNLVQFMNDQLFYDREGAVDLLDKIISLGLNKRFRFTSAGTIDSFIKGGKVDSKLISLLHKANIISVFLGTEALNNKMLAELKNGRYTAADAAKVLDAFSRAKVRTESYMLAGGVNTRAIDFVESYYNLVAKSVRGRKYGLFGPKFGGVSIVTAHREAPLHEQALKEGALFNRLGQKVKKDDAFVLRTRLIFPKDRHLRSLFRKKTLQAHGEHYLPSFGAGDFRDVVSLAGKLARHDPKAAKIHRRLLKLRGHADALNREELNVASSILLQKAIQALRRRKVPVTRRNILKFSKKYPELKDYLAGKSTLLAKRRIGVLSTLENELQSGKLNQREMELGRKVRLKGITMFRKRTGLSWTARTPVSGRRSLK